MGKLGKRKRARDAAAFGEALVDAAGESTDSRIIDFAAAALGADSLARCPSVWSSAALKSLRAALHPLLAFEASRGAHFEARVNWKGEPPPDTSASALAPLRLAADALSADLATFASPAARVLRRALHPFVVAARGVDAAHESLVARTTRAFRARDWPRALSLLRDVAASGKSPRLGTLQRWVRDADLARSGDDRGQSVGGYGDGGGTDSESDGADGRAAEAAAARASVPSGEGGAGATSSISLLLLDAVLRAADASSADAAVSRAASAGAGAGGGAAEAVAVAGSCSAHTITATLVRHAPFCAPPLAAVEGEAEVEAEEIGGLAFAARVVAASRVVSLVPGASRRPPSLHDLRVWTTASGALLLSQSFAGRTARVDVPSVPGAFLLLNLLSRSECTRLISTAEAIGYAADAVPGIDALQMVVQEPLLGAVFARAAPHLPKLLGGDSLASLNARWRLFRYAPGVDYRAHIDGAWPGSGLDATGTLVDDVFNGERVSRLTFLIYLNSDFGGGSTTFFLPRAGAVGTIDAFAVQPVEGAALCFPHGDAASLVHEGSAVEAGGVKYVIRTDVLFQRCRS